MEKFSKSEVLDRKSVKQIVQELANPPQQFIYKKPNEPNIQKEDLVKNYKRKWRGK